MKIGDLVKVIANDKSLIIPIKGVKNDKFFDQIGVLLDRLPHPFLDHLFPDEWWLVHFPAGIYEARYSALEVIND